MDEYGSAAGERPGCVTAYAILAWVGAAVYLIAAFVAGMSIASEVITAGVMILVCGWLLAAIPIATGFGLWQMKKWGWGLVILSQTVGVIGGLFYMLAAFLAANIYEALPLLCGGLTGLLINGGILYWFVTNRHLFDRPTYIMGPEGTMVQKSADNTMVIIVIGGVVIVLCLVPIFIIAILTLLGPQIGEVFSNIVDELGTPMP